MPRAGLVSALLVAVLAVGGCSASPRCPAGASCPASLPPGPAYLLTVNGHSVPAGRDDALPRIRVAPGQPLVIDVTVTMPRHTSITALWLGISAASYGFSHHRPAGLNPILAVSRKPMSAGPRTFRLRWRFPWHHRGALLLVSAWSSSRPSADVARPIATLTRT